MAEVNRINSAAAWNEHREPRSMGLGGSQLLNTLETALGPLVLVFSLWALAFHFENSVPPAYLILSLIVFSLVFPGTSQLHLPIVRVLFNIAFQWLWLAGILLLTGYATHYLLDFQGLSSFIGCGLRPPPRLAPISPFESRHPIC